MACRASRVGRRPPISRGRRIRCAIYTRKSSEEGLEQEFNSLDAQREACEAFVRSQRHEGWIILPHLYDDVGYSGGTMERPALKTAEGSASAGTCSLTDACHAGPNKAIPLPMMKQETSRRRGVRERQGARVFERERASPAFGYD